MDTKTDTVNLKHLSELERNFILSLKEFVESPEGKGRDKLFVSYNKLLGSLSDDSTEKRDKKLLLVFSFLVEQLDNAPDGEIAETLYNYTFRDFLEFYSEESAVQAAIQDYVNSNTLRKLPLRIALSHRRAAAEQ